MTRSKRVILAFSVLLIAGAALPLTVCAQQLITADPPEQVLGIAQNYEFMAERAEQRARGQDLSAALP